MGPFTSNSNYQHFDSKRGLLNAALITALKVGPSRGSQSREAFNARKSARHPETSTASASCCG
eukprot:3989921-Alexandrium_andersonii.AAC.1